MSTVPFALLCGSGPDGVHGTTTAGDWETVLTDAAVLGTRTVCFIGKSGSVNYSPALREAIKRAYVEVTEKISERTRRAASAATGEQSELTATVTRH